MTFFQSFCESLTVPQQTRSSIAMRYKTITKRLNQDFWNSSSDDTHSRYVGSYGRGTAVKGFSDLDVLFQLPYEVYKRYNNYSVNGQSALLQAVSNSLQETYSTTPIKGDGQIVLVDLSDGMKFEIVPCFINKDGSFTYPDSNQGGTWKVTNPLPEINTIQENNKATRGNLVNLCRMTRAWKNKWDVPMGGLLIDTFANNFLMNSQYKNITYSDYMYMARDFFKYMANQKQSQSYWLAVGSNQQIDRKGIFENKAHECFDLASQAIEYHNKNQMFTAIGKWKEIYG